MYLYMHILNVLDETSPRKSDIRGFAVLNWMTYGPTQLLD